MLDDRGPEQCGGRRRTSAEHAVDIRLHFSSRLIAVGRILGQSLHDDGIDVSGDVGVRGTGPSRGLGDVLENDAHHGIADERRLADKQFVQQASRRIEITACIGRFASTLFG